MKTLMMDAADGGAALPTTMQRVRIAARLQQIAQTIKTGTVMQRVKLNAERVSLLKQLGIRMGSADDIKPTLTPDPPPVVNTEPKAETAHLYQDGDSVSKGKRQKANNAAVDLLRELESSGRKPTEEEKAQLAAYTGTGGGLMRYNGKTGSPHEYYTPKPIAEGMWSLMAELGFKGGRVLDPSAGTGVFGATAPASAAVDAVEMDEVSGGINALLNAGQAYSVKVQPFEEVAGNTPDETHDAIVTNVPFGAASLRVHANKDTKYRKHDLGPYFVLRSLDKLKPGGLACFITPHGMMDGKADKMIDFRRAASLKAEFMGAYRLPNKVFDSAGADVLTDVMVWRKYSRDAAERIAECREQSPDTLTASKVLWDEFLEGRYFTDEGRRFVLGNVVQAKNRFGDVVDAVESDASFSDMAKAMRRFGKSRIDWQALNAAETLPIEYSEGDALHRDGQSLMFKDGRWQPVESNDGAFGVEMDMVAASIQTPAEALASAVTWAQAQALGAHLLRTDAWAKMPDWARAPYYECEHFADKDRDRLWRSLVLGWVIHDAREDHAGEVGFNYAEAYSLAHKSIPELFSFAKNTRSRLTNSGNKDTLSEVVTVYDAKEGYASYWIGKVEAATPSTSMTGAQSTYERMSYGGGKPDYVPVSALKADDASFDPMTSDDWCVSADGKGAMRADDYYHGSLADFYTRVDADIAACVDEAVKTKLIRQRNNIADRIIRPDPTRMRFNLQSPFVGINEKLAFARQYIDPSFNIETNDDGERIIKADLDSAKMSNRRSDAYVEAKAKELFWTYFQKGTFTMRGTKDLDDDIKQRIVTKMQQMAATANKQFDTWAKVHQSIQAEIAAIAADPQKAFFRHVENGAPFEIAGTRADAKAIRPHGYQFASIRRFSRNFSGILGDGVGLGKTSQTLFTMQHMHNIGVKKRTFVVVPKSVMNNWQLEASRIYEDMGDCLFVGMRELKNKKTGKMQLERGDGDEVRKDLKSIANSRARKVFMTYDDFQMIPMKPETLDEYLAYVRETDTSMRSQKTQKAQDRVDAMLGRLREMFNAESQDTSVTRFEDMGADSLVWEEAHALKNSKSAVDFQGAKYLATPMASARGLKAQLCSWWVRQGQRDGVLCLTATPVTNSPLEIYSMLALSMGEENAQHHLMGVKGADDFLATFGQIEDIDGTDVSGLPKVQRTFTGIQSLGLIRDALEHCLLARNANDVGEAIIVPERNPISVDIDLPQETNLRLKKYAGAYRAARAAMAKGKGQQVLPGDSEALDEVLKETGLASQLLAHPFNMINRLERLIMDADLDAECTRYTVPKAQAAAAMEAVEKFNALKLKDERERHTRMSDESDVVPNSLKVEKNEDGDIVGEKFKVFVKAVYLDAQNAIEIDTMDFEAQGRFEAIAEKLKLDLNGSVSPKVAALIANVQKELETPRNMNARDGETVARSKPKQIIFCDSLAMHRKLKMLLVKHCGIPSSKITFISAPAAPDPLDVQKISDGFNADGDDNIYQIVIANKKAEVGINLQKGCQAIHFLTLGWTPDSVEQRLGRGVRQGNITAFVNLYFYEATGTFDKYRRTMVSAKADWIESALSKDGGDSVDISGGLSDEQVDSLINTVGDADGGAKFQQQQAESEAARTKQNRRSQQLIDIQTIQANRTAADGEFVAFVVAEMQRAKDANEAVNAAQKRLEKAKNERARAIAQALVEERGATMQGMRAAIREAYPTVSLNSEGQWRNPTDAYFKSHAPNETSELYVRWTSQKDMADKLVKQSEKSFAAIAANGGGAYSKAVLEKLATGKALVIGGTVVCEGDLLRAGDDKKRALLVVNIEQSYRSAPFVARAWLPTTGNSITVSDALASGGAMIDEESAAYDSALTEAAELDDEKAARIKLSASTDERDRGNFYHAYIPAVAERMTYQVPIILDAETTRLPPPLFPRSISKNNYSATASPALANLRDAQIAAGFERSDSDVSAPKGHSTEQVTRESLTAQTVSAMWDTLTNITPNDMSLCDVTGKDFAVEAMRRDASVGGLRDALASSNFEDAVALNAAVAKGVEQWLPCLSSGAVGGLSGPVRWLPDDLRATYEQRKTEIAANIQRQQNADRERQALEAAKALEALPVVGIKDGPKAGFNSGTYAHKEKLKAATKAATGGKVDAVFDKPPPSWTIPRDALDGLKRDYVKLFEDGFLAVTPPSEKGIAAFKRAMPEIFK